MHNIYAFHWTLWHIFSPGDAWGGGLLESCTYWRAVAINKVITVCTQSKQQLAGDSLLLVCIIYVLFYMYNFSGDFDK